MAVIAREDIRGTRAALRGASLPSQSLSPIVAALDAGLLMIASSVGSFSYRSYMMWGSAPTDGSIGVGLLAAALFLLLAHSQGLYRLQSILNPMRHLSRTLLLFGMSVLTLTCLLFLLKVGADYSRGFVIVFAVFSAVLLPLGRILFSSAAHLGIRKGVIRGRRVVTLGDASELEKLRASDLLQFGVHEIARVAVIDSRAKEADFSQKLRERVARAIEMARNLHAIEFALVMPWSRDQDVAQISNFLRISPLAVKLFPDHRVRGILSGQNGRGLSQYFSVTIQREPLNRWERATKRVLDFAGASLALIALAPLLLLVAVAIKLESRGPAIFRQRRRGFDGREFIILKFRTMNVLDDGDSIVQATQGDDRVTRIGRILRRTSVDELPQLLNVLRGEMSLVGPRPHAVAHDEAFGARIATYAMRHHVKPGLTGAAQIEGLRGRTERLDQMEQRVERDIWYINNWSFALDLKIMALTCYALFRHDAY
jgi:Undecaprenyl-phosphate glucose phosphotransferase